MNNLLTHAFLSLAAATTITSAAVAQPGPDLQILGLTASSTKLAPGGTSTIRVTVENDGQVATRGFSIGIQLNRSAQPKSSAGYFHEIAVPSLAANSRRMLTSQITVPRSAPDGMCYIVAWADVRGQIGESNESNNSMSIPAICAGVVDLELVSFQLTSLSWAHDAYVNVDATVTNMGGKAAPATQLAYYLSDDDVLDPGDNRLLRYQVQALGAGQSGSSRTVVRIPVGAAMGACYLIAHADDAAVSGDFDLNNNAKAVLGTCYLPGSVDSFGTGCGGASTLGRPALNATNTDPYIGGSTSFVVFPGTPGESVLLVVGASNLTWNGISLPLPVDFLGAAGCTLLVSMDAQVAVGTDPQGVATLPVTIPNSMGLVGAEVFMQALAVDASANALGLRFSNGLAIKVGSQR